MLVLIKWFSFLTAICYVGIEPLKLFKNRVYKAGIKDMQTVSAWEELYFILVGRGEAQGWKQAIWWKPT